MHQFKSLNANEDLVTRINGSFTDHYTFVMQSRIKPIYNMDEFVSICSFIYLFIHLSDDTIGRQDTIRTSIAIIIVI